MGPQPPVELHVTLGVGAPKYPASHVALHTLLTALVGEQLNDPLAGAGGGRLHTAGKEKNTTQWDTMCVGCCFAEPWGQRCER